MIMSLRHASAFAGILLLSAVASAYAGAKDFEFQPVTVDVKTSGAELAVRLVDKRTGKPVPGAIIFRSQLDMSPDGMDEMLAKHEPLPPAEPGVYRFKADLSMAGDWALKLQAKVPGEQETLEGTIVFKAVD